MNIIIPDVQDDIAGGDLSETMVSRQEIKDSMVFFSSQFAMISFFISWKTKQLCIVNLIHVVLRI